MTTPIDLTESVALIADQRQAILVEGPDAVSFLQGQLSQDIEALAPGECGWSLLLHPHGKISAWFRITRVGDDRLVIDVDYGWAEEVLTRLNRFKLRTDCEIVAAPWQSVTVVGSGADEIPVEGVEHDMITSWAGVPVRDLFGASPAVGPGPIAELSVGQFVALRIEAGVPQMGHELDENTIPAAAGIVEQSVSFTKGCYTGQELVARIDSRGNNVPKRLLSVVNAAGAPPAVGSDVSVDGQVVGVITSSGHSARLGAGIGLAYIGRAVDAGATVDAVDASGDAMVVELRDVPLIAG